MEKVLRQAEGGSCQVTDKQSCCQIQDRADHIQKQQQNRRLEHEETARMNQEKISKIQELRSFQFKMKQEEAQRNRIRFERQKQRRTLSRR
jgi:hypothetical protein